MPSSWYKLKIITVKSSTDIDKFFKPYLVDREEALIEREGSTAYSVAWLLLDVRIYSHGRFVRLTDQDLLVLMLASSCTVSLSAVA